MKKLIFVLCLLFVGGCKTVPESVQEARKEQLTQVSGIASNATEAWQAQPMVEVSIKLPPGRYEFEVPEEGWELARTTVREPLRQLLEPILEQTEWQISENVAISALRIIGPVIAFLGGQHYTAQMHQQNTRMVRDISAGSMGVASQAISTPPTVIGGTE